MKRVLIAFTIICVFGLLYGCSLEETTNNLQDTINQKIEKTKQDVSNKVETYVEKTVNNKVDSTVKSIESTMDPKLGEIRKNMNNIKEAALAYYKINKKMPIQQKIEPFFQTSFIDMKIQYKISNDNQRAFITYIGKEYSKDKVGEIIIEPNQN